MFATASVNLSPHTLLALLEYLRDTGAITDLAEAVDTAVRHWLASMKENTSDGAHAAPRGYQWKSLFLPDGAWVRMAYRGDHEYAHVEGDHLMYKGRPTTPKKFASDHTDTVRNAWLDISIRMPGEKNWKMAYQRRKELELAARQAIQPASASASAPASAPPAPPASSPPPAASLASPSLPPPASPAWPTSLPSPTSPSLAPAASPSPPTSPLAPARDPAPASPPRAGGSVVPLPPTMQRDTTPGPGWTEPERRKFRYRIEDVAFN